MSDELLESIDGCFVYTIYRSDSYMVSKFETDEGTITVTGPSFDYVKGEKYTLSGTYVDHPRYGFQFNILSVNKYKGRNNQVPVWCCFQGCRQESRS